MKIAKIPLDVRLQAARNGLAGQPEYLPALVRQWGGTRIRAYFGECTQELDRLYALLRLRPGEDPTYQDVARMIFELRCTPMFDTASEATKLLVAPARNKWEKFRKRSGDNG